MAEAMGSYDQALQRKPDHAEVHLNRALTWLGMGDFEKGWPEYEWRLKVSQYAIPSFRQPLWDGSPLDGRTHPPLMPTMAWGMRSSSSAMCRSSGNGEAG